jgi:hypothetical protein
VIWLVYKSKDWVNAEFPFSFFSHKLTLDVRKENAMSTIVLAIILLIRIILPLGLLIALGEWIHRREADYWLRR